VVATEKVSPFVWVDAITQKKSDPMVEHGEKAYPAFMINRSLSYYPDTIMHAAEINLYQHLDLKLQYDYYMEAVRSKKRFSKWGKKSTSKDVELIMETYRFSRVKAEAASKILTKEQLAAMKESRERGVDNG
jgi:clamp loader A subunit